MLHSCVVLAVAPSGLGAVGLFRVAANLAAVRELLLRHKLRKRASSLMSAQRRFDRWLASTVARAEQPIDVNACDDPHVVAAFLLQLLRDRDPSPVDFNKMNAIDCAATGVAQLFRGCDSVSPFAALCALHCSSQRRQWTCQHGCDGAAKPVLARYAG